MHIVKPYWLRALNYRKKRSLLERSRDKADRKADDWTVRVIEAERDHGRDSEQARSARARVDYFSGVADKARALLVRLEAEDKP